MHRPSNAANVTKFSKPFTSSGLIITCFISCLAFSSRKAIVRHLSARYAVTPFSTIYTLNAHFLNQHSSDLQKFTCDECNTDFETKQLLRDHCTSQHERGLANECPDCGRTFTSKHAWICHRQQHKSKIKTYPCSTCGRVYSSKLAVTIHYRSHTGERPYSCHVCHAGFSNRGSLVVHRKAHEGKSQYACSFCGKKFIYRLSLQIHETLMRE